MAQTMERVIEHIERNRDRYLEELKEFLRIPSVSTDPANRREVARAADFVAGQLERVGMERVEVFPTPGHPIVFGEGPVLTGRPTVLVYGHYDVQPVDPLELWESGPFEPTVRNGELYARGAADDKGQVFIHFKSVEAFTDGGGQLPVNVKFLVEGEEEIGSPNLETFIRSNQDLLRADVMMVSDTAMFARGVPSICYGLRGLVYFQVDLEGASGDLHSGSFGGPVVNPAFELARILSKMKDEAHRVTIPHFYDAVRDLTEDERRELEKLPFDAEAYMRSLGLAALTGEKGYSPLEQLWTRPTFEVNGLAGGFSGEGAKTVLPARAMAKVSMRLVPDQEPELISELFEEYLRTVAPSSVKLRVTRMHGGKPWVTSLDHPALVAGRKALKKGFGKEPVFQREGGSIPVVATFAEILNTPSVLMGIGLPDENAHAPNEKLDLENFYNGIKSSAFFLDEMSKASV